MCILTRIHTYAHAHTRIPIYPSSLSPSSRTQKAAQEGIPINEKHLYFCAPDGNSRSHTSLQCKTQQGQGAGLR